MDNMNNCGHGIIFAAIITQCISYFAPLCLVEANKLSTDYKIKNKMNEPNAVPSLKSFCPAIF